MIFSLLSRGLSKVAQAGSIERAEARPQITRQSVENIDGSKSVQTGLAIALAVSVWCGLFFFAFFADHRGENENAFFSPFNEAATVVGPNLDVLKAQQAHSSSDERQEFTSPERRLAIVTCDNAAKT